MKEKYSRSYFLFNFHIAKEQQQKPTLDKLFQFSLQGFSQAKEKSMFQLCYSFVTISFRCRSILNENSAFLK